jgi:non-canonical poly(A) RNA polymerase PAPD5/7
MKITIINHHHHQAKRSHIHGKHPSSQLSTMTEPTTNHDEENPREELSEPQDSLDADFVSLDNIGGDERDEEEISQPEETRQSQFRSGDLPPWMHQYTDYRRVNSLVALHNEIVGFCKLMEPRPEELKEREQLVQKFTELVHSVFGECQVDVFGSQVTGLCLPTSDIDISIQLDEEEKEDAKSDSKAETNDEKSEKEEKEKEKSEMEHWETPSGTPLDRLAAALRSEWMPELSYLEVIPNTRIPLVKFTHIPTNVSVDVCFNQRTGPHAAKLMKQYMEAMPPLRPLTFVLKYFMASRDLNQPYTGGVGSFMLQVMIVSFLQHRERDAFNYRRPSLYNLGALLVEFLELYSTDFNFITTGLSVRFDGFYFPKGAADRKKDFWQPQRPFSLAIENPLEPTADVGKASFRMSTVQRSFEVAFKVLLSHVTEPAVPAVSILASTLPPTEEMRKRSTLTRLKPLQAGRSNQDPREEPPRKRRRR